MMSWIDYAAVAYLLAYLGALAYGLLHRDDPFWRGFTDPLGLREDR